MSGGTLGLCTYIRDAAARRQMCRCADVQGEAITVGGSVICGRQYGEEGLVEVHSRW